MYGHVSIDLMMPFYGDPELFRLAVESVLSQDDPDWRLVVIDDQYPDVGPGEWLQKIADPRVVYLRNETNLGVSGNFRRCVDLATADFTTIVGCDDLLLPNYVSGIRALLADFSEADFVQPGVEVMDATGAVVLPLADRVKRMYRPAVTGATQLSGEDLATSLLAGAWTYFPSIAWRTERLKRHGFRTDLDVTLDLALIIDIVSTEGILVVDTVPSFRYRRHSASVSSWRATDGSRFLEEQRFFTECAEQMAALGWNRAARTATRHLSSRLNALTRLPASVGAKDAGGIRVLLQHAFSQGSPPQSSEPKELIVQRSLDVAQMLSRTLIVMPAYNEEEAVGDVVREVYAALPGVTCLVVNDGSRDATTAVARAAGALVAELPVNLGVGGAMRLGFKYALAHGFDNVVQIDSDGQHDPASVLSLLARLDVADLVIGARFAGAGEYEARGPRRWAMRFLAAILSHTARTRLTDTTSGFKASGPRAVALFAMHYPAEYLGDTIEALVIAARAGCVIEQVPVVMRVRAGGQPSHDPLKAAAYLGRAFIALCFALIRPSMSLEPKA